MLSHAGKTTVLVVEDNVEVQDLVQRILKADGFNVLTADNAAAGLASFQEHPEIKLVFSDLILPGGMTGIDLAKEILKLKPTTLFLLGSGYSEKGDLLKRSTQGRKNFTFIPKPYDPDKISREVRLMLGTQALAAWS